VADAVLKESTSAPAMSVVAAETPVKKAPALE
jgi:hypothetical protein